MWIDEICSSEKWNILAALDIGLKVPEWRISGEKVKEKLGVPLTVFGYYDAGEISDTVLAIMDNYLLSGDQGIKLESNCMTVWQEPCQVYTKYLNHFKELLRIKQPDYSGIVGISGYLDGKRAWYEKVHIGPPEGFVVPRIEKFAASIKTWEWPNIQEFGLITSEGESVKKAWTNIYIQTDGIDSCFRTDGGVVAKKVYRALKEGGYI